uniref:Uncharacterized protein n=1 Tax=viral metagenome TaxID=1070528 RepID=A0A6C0KIG1_9ZZZZ
MGLELAICELYHPYIHGYDNNNNNIYGHYLINETYSSEEFYNNEQDELLDIIKEGYETRFPNVKINNSELSHPFINNYWSIVKKDNHVLDIVQKIEKDTGETLAIKKTFWLKIFQRRWRNILKERQHIINMRKCPKAITYRQIYGDWPEYCRIMK